MLQWVIGVWYGYSRGVRIAAVTLWSLGAFCIIVGAIGDSNGFWVERPFLTNLVSSLAGASFGIPVAILVLQQVSMRQAKVAELREWTSEAFRELQTLRAIVVLRKGDRPVPRELMELPNVLRDLLRSLEAGVDAHDRLNSARSLLRSLDLRATEYRRAYRKSYDRLVGELLPHAHRASLIFLRNEHRVAIEAALDRIDALVNEDGFGEAGLRDPDSGDVSRDQLMDWARTTLQAIDAIFTANSVIENAEKDFEGRVARPYAIERLGGRLDLPRIQGAELRARVMAAGVRM